MALPIEAYGLIGDLQTAALVGTDGSIDWLCLPRFDSAACFAALLDEDRAGRWRIAPAGAGTCTRRRYVEDTLVLETEWETEGGTVRVVDLMPPRDEAVNVVRIVEGVQGEVEMALDLVLRFDYGRIVPWVRQGEGVWSAVAGPDAVWLETPVRLVGRDLRTQAEFTVRAGERVPFVLTWRPSHLPRPVRIHPFRAREQTEAYWHEWMAGYTYDGRWDEAVRRSALTLKALQYGPTGGLAAAATTSLPEEIGGVRNWDYRYCWLRDAAFTLQALLGTGFVAEAKAWRDWLLRAVAGDPAELQIMYGIDGTRRLPEFTLDWLAGYDGARPVRVGNAAADQFQLDVWGEVLDCLSLGRAAGLEPDDSSWSLQRAFLDFLEEHWQDPDNSLWEVRGPRRHFVHSKVLAWVAFDRAVKAVEELGQEGPVERWREVRDAIHREVCERGFDPVRGTFTQFYGSEGLDAALLLIPRVGFLDWQDPRVLGTVEAIQRELCEDGYVLRYRPMEDGEVDGLPGREGAFLACSFWMADALYGIGREDDATELFEHLLAVRNDLGLMSEEYDPRLQRQVGNTPQAFSHLALINAARHLSGARPAEEEGRRSAEGGGATDAGVPEDGRASASADDRRAPASVSGDDAGPDGGVRGAEGFGA